MIIDAFTFFNELELLDIRLHELSNVVDKFILVEATRTHSGKFKPLYFEENKSEFKHYNIRHIIVNDLPNDDDYWVPERYQREVIKQGLINCKDEDLILISDVDEIPKSSIIKENEFVRTDTHYVFEQRLHYYYLNTYFPVDKLWRGTVAVRFKYLKKKSIEYFRHMRVKGIKIPNAGWHFSYLGGANKIKVKLDSFAHKEFNSPFYKDKKYIDQCISTLTSLFNPKEKLVCDQYKTCLPEYVFNNQDLFKKFIL